MERRYLESMEKQTGCGGHYSITVIHILFDFGIKKKQKKLFKQDLRFHPCTATSIDYLLQLLSVTEHQQCYAYLIK